MNLTKTAPKSVTIEILYELEDNMIRTSDLKRNKKKQTVHLDHAHIQFKY